MTRIATAPPLSPSTQLPQQGGRSGGALDRVQIEDFLDLMIAELQNQDPLEPLDNAQLLAQISQIREIGSTDQLTQTLQAVLRGQHVVTASRLLGQTIEGLSADGEKVRGTVERVSVDDDEGVRLHIGEAVVPVDRVRLILQS